MSTDLATLQCHVSLFSKLGAWLLPLHRPIWIVDKLRCSCGNPKCRAPAKHPDGVLAPEGLKNASNDPRVLTEWFGLRSPNVGMLTGASSGIVVLDIDPRHGGDEFLRDLEHRYGQLPPTWRFLTGGGGEHIIFRHPALEIRNSAGKIGPGIDVRGDGGYIVVPPSLHISGRSYAISVDHHPDDVPLADPPEWLLSLLRETRRSRNNASALPQVVTAASSSLVELRRLSDEGVPEGQRNTGLARMAGHLLGKGVDADVALDLLLAFNITKCHPPLDECEVLSIVTNIAIRQARRSRHVL